MNQHINLTTIKRSYEKQNKIIKISCFKIDIFKDRVNDQNGHVMISRICE